MEAAMSMENVFLRCPRAGWIAGLLLAAILLGAAPPTRAQATSRSCDAEARTGAHPGPACLLAHLQLGSLGGAPVYWTLDSDPDSDALAAPPDASVHGVVVQAFGKTWRFTVGPLQPGSRTGKHLGVVGPIPVDRTLSYDAEFLMSTFSPGMSAPIHLHSGPEAFYAVSGETCLETPDGVQVGRHLGNSMVVRGGPPMLLMALGHQPRQGFALILHDAARPPTTLVHDWAPRGLCQAQLRQGQGSAGLVGVRQEP
jgi:hypothetical protein